MTLTTSAKEAFPIFSRLESANTPFHYLDNAATTHKPQCVIDAISNAYASDYGPVARGLYPLAESATRRYETAREKVAEFIGATPDTVIFTSGTTSSLNMAADHGVKPFVEPGQEIWVGQAEHHANYLPWLRVCEQTGATLKIIEIDKEGKLVVPSFDAVASGQVACIALSLVSNVLGCYSDVVSVIKQAKAHGIVTVVDAAQAVVSKVIDVSQIGCDFLAFSAHKMFGPTGIGILYASSEHIERMHPMLLGGGMVDCIGSSYSDSSWVSGVQGFEAGSPNLAGAIGLQAAVEFIEGLERQKLKDHVSQLAINCALNIRSLDGYEVIGTEENWRSGIVTFVHDTVHPHDIAQVCADYGVAIRAGHHCAQPLIQALGYVATARASISIYNDHRDIDALIHSLKEAAEMFAL